MPDVLMVKSLFTVCGCVGLWASKELPTRFLDLPVGDFVTQPRFGGPQLES